MYKHNNISPVIQDITLYLSLSVNHSFLAELNPNGIKACIVYKEWIKHLFIEVAAETNHDTQELITKITYILNKQLLKLLQPEYILSELINEQAEIQE